MRGRQSGPWHPRSPTRPSPTAPAASRGARVVTTWLGPRPCPENHRSYQWRHPQQQRRRPLSIAAHPRRARPHHCRHHHNHRPRYRPRVGESPADPTVWRGRRVTPLLPPPPHSWAGQSPAMAAPLLARVPSQTAPRGSHGRWTSAPGSAPTLPSRLPTPPSPTRSAPLQQPPPVPPAHDLPRSRRHTQEVVAERRGPQVSPAHTPAAWCRRVSPTSNAAISPPYVHRHSSVYAQRNEDTQGLRKMRKAVATTASRPSAQRTKAATKTHTKRQHGPSERTKIRKTIEK